MVLHERSAEGGTTANVETEDQAATGRGTTVRAVASGDALGWDVTGKGTFGESSALDISLVKGNHWLYQVPCSRDSYHAGQEFDV
jgi:hypothetical protein